MKYLKKIFELFDFKNYKQISYSFGKKYLFQINNNVYECVFDEIFDNVYNHYFYLIEDDKKMFNLINNKNNNLKVFSNIRNISLDFLNENIYVSLIVFSSYETERNDLYTLYAQSLRKNSLDSFFIKNVGNISYYIIYDKKIEGLLLDKYLTEIVQENKKFKK
jgi:hypothetical protein